MKHPSFRLGLFWLGLFWLGLFWLGLCLLLPAAAQTSSPPLLPPEPSLEASLQALPPSSVAPGSVVLTIAPKTIKPLPTPAAGPADPVPPTLESTADRYGRSERWFSHVGALAPPAMTVLNTSPALADLPIGSLAVQHPETYLLGSLTPAQLKQVAGPGLAYAEMTPGQQSLVQALVPEPLEIVPASAVLPERTLPDAVYKTERDKFDAQIQKVGGADLYAHLRFHAYLTASFYLHVPNGYGIGDTRELSETTGAFKLPISGYRNMDRVGKGIETVLKSDFPNTPKPGDLEWGTGRLSRTVSLEGLKTVDDLTARLAKATGLELYADTHYGPKALLALGDLKTQQPSGDVMQALALCVCGTWRRVGPAYVLTDDLAGLGARQQFLAETAEIWANRLASAGRDAGAQLAALDWLHTLPFVPGDIGALTPAQVAAIRPEFGKSVAHLAWKDLSPSLQTHLLDIFSHYGDEFPHMPDIAEMGDRMKTAAQSVRPDSTVDATVNIRLGVELPSTGVMMLYGDYEVRALEDPKPDTPAKDAAPASSGPYTLTQPLRAVLCAPQTPDEARAVVAKLPRMGLNTLFLDVFTNGRTYFPNSALPPASGSAANVLAAALAAAKPRHIPVYAVVDTLCWRKDGLAPHPLAWPAGFGEEVTISGETPDKAIQRRFAAGSLRTDYDHPKHALAEEGTEGWAGPLDPAVQAALPPLIGSLAVTPGLAGLVFQDTAPPGYSDDYVDYGDRIGLGYTLQNRLAYLRQTHQDPVDLVDSDRLYMFVSGENFSGHYDIGIPTFGMTPDTYAAWEKHRAAANRVLLEACRQSARTAVLSLLLLRRTGIGLTSFVPWTAADPGVPVRRRGTDLLVPTTPSTVYSIGFSADDEAHPDSFRELLSRFSSAGAGGKTREDRKPGQESKAGGVVFDLVTGGPRVSLLDTLDRLQALLDAGKINPPK